MGLTLPESARGGKCDPQHMPHLPVHPAEHGERFTNSRVARSRPDCQVPPRYMTVSVEKTPAIPPRVELPVSFGRAWVVESVRDIDAAVRESAYAHHCKDFRFYGLIEETLPEQFKYRYFVL